MRKKKYVIPIEPIAWKRPGRNGDRYYDAQQHDKVSFGLIVHNIHNGQPLFHDGPLELVVTFFMPIPESRKDIKEGDWQFQTPDWDNLGKWLGDALKNVIITDDRRISSAFVQKKYSHSPRVEFYIRELNNES